MSRRDYTTDDARDALQHCDPGTDRRQWVRILAAAKDAGLVFDDVLTWSASAPNFTSERDVQTAWRGIRADGGIKAGTLYHEARARGWTPRQAHDAPRPVSRQSAPAHRPVEPPSPKHTTLSEFGLSIWSQRVPLAGTVGAEYLLARRCVIPPPDGDLRFHPALPYPKLGDTPEERAAQPDFSGPALLALVTDVVTGEPIGLHRTWICADGTKANTPGPARLTLGRHRKQGGCIRLWPDEAITTGLGIAEGIETALSLAHAYRPVWSLVDAGNLGAFTVLPGIEALVIAQDNDPAGREATAACAARWVAAGCTVSIVAAAHDGADLNDITKEVA